jgi:hypothetical protein
MSAVDRFADYLTQLVRVVAGSIAHRSRMAGVAREALAREQTIGDGVIYRVVVECQADSGPRRRSTAMTGRGVG